MEVRLHPMEFAQRPLPYVCALTGKPAAWYMRVEVERPPHPAIYALILLGPPGWLILVLAMLVRRDGTHVEVPVSQYVYDQIHERRRRFRWFTAALVAEVLVFITVSDPMVFPAAWLLFAPSVALAFWVGSVKDHRLRLRLDGVGLVTIKDCHPGFVAAVEQWRAAGSQISTIRL